MKYVILFSVVIFISCKGYKEEYSCATINIDNNVLCSDEFNINELEYENLVYTNFSEITFDTNYTCDINGIILYNYSNSDFEEYNGLYYHPGQMFGKAIGNLDLYVKTGNAIYYSKVIKYANKFIEISDFSRDAMYFPYKFPFKLHETVYYPGYPNIFDVIEPPWYSAMAQGQILSFFCRLYLITEEYMYLDFANKIYYSFQNFDNNKDSWTVLIDQDGYYWLEEYPADPADHVLNGFMFSLLGLYDYYLMTKNESSKNYLMASLTTLKKYLEQFRIVDNPSKYCLRHGFPHPNYHLIHMRYLDEIYKMTNDSYFLEYKILFEKDSPP